MRVAKLMPKVLLLREKRQFVPELNKEVVTTKARRWLVYDITKDFSTAYGVLTKKQLKSKDGSVLKTSTGKELVIFTASFPDMFARWKKLPQAMMFKDLGVIAAETGMNKESTVLDAGTGSGAAACFFAQICKKVVTYDQREDYQALAKTNAELVHAKNIVFKHGDVYEKIPEKNMDVILLDVPEPWHSIEHVAKALKIGGWFVSFSPTIPQVQECCNSLDKNPHFLVAKTIEINERLWKVKGRAVRPVSGDVGHTGFLTFARRIT